MFEYSAPRYWARSLAAMLSGNTEVDFGTRQKLSLEDSSAIVALFTNVLSALLPTDLERPLKPCDIERPTLLLQEAGAGLPEGYDMTNLVLQLFEEHLQGHCEQPSDASLDLLINGLQFMSMLTKFESGRIWSFLARSRLLDLDQSGSNLLGLVAANEMVAGRVQFLTASARFYAALVNDVINNAVSRKGMAEPKALSRFSEVTSRNGSSAPDRIIRKVLLSFTRTILSLSESASSWKSASVTEQNDYHCTVHQTLNKVVICSFGLDSTSDSSTRLLSVLEDSATCIVDLFLDKSSTNLRTLSILNSLFIGTNNPSTSLSNTADRSIIGQTLAALRFSTILLRVAIATDKPSSPFVANILRAMPMLARLLSTDEAYRHPIVELLEVLVRALAKTDQNAPSLLGNLGEESAQCVMSLLATVAAPLTSVEEQVNIWRLFSAVVSNQQQWFAIYLLTGKTPREKTVTANESSPRMTRGRRILDVAIDSLCSFHTRDWRVEVAMLDFVAMALNYWPWTVGALGTNDKLFQSLLGYLNETRENVDAGRKTAEHDMRVTAYVRTAAAIAEVLAMLLHHSMRAGDTSLKDYIVANVGWLVLNGAAMSQYNQALHSNLEKNLSIKFPTIKLANFRRTALLPSNLGHSFVYDVDLADRVLSFDSGWAKAGGYHEEIQRANTNLSLVEAQNLLFGGWQLLVNELGKAVQPLENNKPDDDELSQMLTRVARNCLDANRQIAEQQNVSDTLTEGRANLTVILLQKLLRCKRNVVLVKRLLPEAWEVIRLSGNDFQNSFGGASVNYYRAILRVLLLTVQAQSLPEPKLKGNASAANKQSAPIQQGSIIFKDHQPPFESELMAVFNEVIAKGFRSLARQLHDEPSSVLPTDFVLITAILQALLQVPNIHMLHSQISLAASSQSLTRYAAHLFSWSHSPHLTINNSDPIFAELSILFLQTLSTIPPVAEQLAVDGILNHLASSNITSYFQRPKGMGPFDIPSRLHSIWSRGLLPLCLNLLDAVGAPIAGEVSGFVNRFPAQLSRAVHSLVPKPPSPEDPHASQMSLGMAEEVHTLALITLIIERYRTAGPALGVDASEVPSLAWDWRSAKETVEGFVEGRRGSRGRVVPATEVEAEMDRTRLEERVEREFRGALECLNALSNEE